MCLVGYEIEVAGDTIPYGVYREFKARDGYSTCGSGV
jgi:hypothetical protein